MAICPSARHTEGVNRILVVLLIGGLCGPAVTQAQTIEARDLVTNTSRVIDVEISPFGRYLAVHDATEGNAIRVLDRSHRQLWRHRLSAYWAGSWQAGSLVQFTPDGDYLIVPGYRNDNDIAVLTSATGEVQQVLTDHDEDRMVSALSLSPDGEVLASTTSHELFLWRRDTSSQEQRFEAAVALRDRALRPTALLMGPRGRSLFVAGREEYHRVVEHYHIDFNDGALRLSLQGRHAFEDRNISHDIYSLAISEDGTFLYAGYRETVLVFPLGDRHDDAAAPSVTWEPQERITTSELGNVYALVALPGDRRLITGHSRQLRLWRRNGSAWQPELTVATQQPVPWDLELAPDARSLYLGSDGRSDALVRFAVGEIPATATGLVLSALDGPLSPAQRRILTPTVAAEMLRSVGESRFAPRDMFETAEEYRVRRTRLRDSLRESLARRVEEQYVSDAPAWGTDISDITILLEGQGSYDVDARRYTVPLLSDTAWLSIDRDDARKLYQRWEEARVLMTRDSRGGSVFYTDPRLAHPENGRRYPLVLPQNPFTGAPGGNDQRRIPEISVGPDLRIRNLELPGVFPALYPTYRQNPFGTMEIVNSGTGIISDLTITVAVPGVLAAPIPVDVPGSLVAGRSLPVKLTGSVSPDILTFGQGRTLPLSLELAYRGSSGEHRQTVQREMLVYNRNALRWSDDRRVGAFVTVDDSDLVGWTGEVLSALERPPSPVVTREVLAALHLFGALSEQGVRYVVDPSSAYAERSQSGAIDYLRFPRETLRYQAGDCDDLSVLYNTLLEIAGVSTAFITTPGHIFTAFDSGLTAEKMQRMVSDPRRYLVHQGRAWIPVETTVLRDGFVVAWQTGAQQWQAAQTAGTASFFVTADAWQAYRPVAVPESAVPESPVVPRVSTATDQELAALWDRDLEPLLAALESRRRELSLQDYHNRMGVLNAQYGRLDTAAQHFDQALRAFDYVPALINRANVAALQGQNREARVYLERAAAQDADNSRILLGLAWAQWRSGDREAAEASWRAAESLEPRLAAQYPLAQADSAGGTRATSAASAGPFAQEWSVTEP